MTTTARDTLVRETMPLIQRVARRLAHRLPASVDLGDLEGAGALGLLDAAQKFDPDRGVQFGAYAESRVRGAILDSLRTQDWAPRSLRKQGRELERVCSRLEQALGRPATEEEISRELGRELNEVRRLVVELDRAPVSSFEDLRLSAKQRGRVLVHEHADDAGDPHKRFEHRERRVLLRQAIRSLPEKECLVLSFYYYEERSMREIAEVLGVSESRVSQIHGRATRRLRSKLNRVSTLVD